MFRKIQKLLRSTKGVATSLLEATATIAVGATLAGAAVGVVTDKIQDARIAQAQGDVQALADAINTFEKDNLFYPIFESSGNASASSSASGAEANPFTSSANSNRTINTETNEVELLISAAGDFFGTDGDGATTFGIALGRRAVTGWQTTTTSFNQSSATDHIDTFENQLNENNPKYKIKGAIAFDKNRGYAGPYLGSLAPTDPWGNRYQSNVHYLNDKDLTSSGLVQSFQTIVISAGPNELVQTAFQAQADAGGTVNVKGDDIAYRVR